MAENKEVEIEYKNFLVQEFFYVKSLFNDFISKQQQTITIIGLINTLLAFLTEDKFMVLINILVMISFIYYMYCLKFKVKYINNIRSFTSYYLEQLIDEMEENVTNLFKKVNNAFKLYLIIIFILYLTYFIYTNEQPLTK